MRVSVTFFMLLAAIISACAQTPPTMWERTYGGANNEQGNCVRQTPDGGFAVSGVTNSFGAGGLDMWLLRVSAQGDSLWSQTYGGIADEYCFGMAVASDGFLLAGLTWSFGAGGADYWLVKTDLTGNRVWSRTYGGSADEQCYAILPAGDGGYFLGGHGINVLKVDADGDSIWALRLGGTAKAITSTSDGNFVAGGFWGSDWPGDASFWLLKFSPEGHVLWNQVYNENCGDQCVAVQERVGGGYALFGYSKIGCGREDYWLIRTDSDGNYLDVHSFGGWSYDYCETGRQTSDGGYLLGGYTWSFGHGERDGWVVKTDAAGSTLWSQTYGGTGDEVFHNGIELPNRQYVFVGVTQSFGSGGLDVYLVRIGSDDSILPVELISFEAEAGDQQVHLSWRTASESGIDHFEIRRNGQPVASVSAVNSPSGHAYGWTDVHVQNGETYEYALVEVGMDGSATTLSTTSARPHPSESVANEFRLSQNYPNPFNATTTIEFSIPDAGNVHLRVYDLLGKEVRALVDGPLGAGHHTVEFSSWDIPSGLYFYRLTAGGQKSQRKMVVLK